MDKLSKLGLKYGTDKIGKHNYLLVYYNLFKNRRESVGKVIEMGIAEGASLAMWNDFFPNAMIYGADIQPERVTLELKYPRIQIQKCDQSSQSDLIELLNETGSDIDLFIDDGSHKPEDQLFTALRLLEILDKGVVYIIEDVKSIGVAVAIQEALRYNDYKVEIIECGKRYDDRLVICQK